MTNHLENTEKFKHRILTDLGFACRHLFGFDYDEDEETHQKIRPGGIRKDGPHGEVTSLLDNWHDNPFLMVLMCRDAYKSSMAKAFVAQQIIANVNNNHFYAMKTKPLAADKVADIQRLVTLPLVKQCFGIEEGFPWRYDKFSVSGRDPSLPQDNHNCVAVGVNEGYTGPHVKGGVIDDCVDEDSTKTEIGLEEGITFLEKIIPVIEPGGWLLIMGTLYHQLDLYHYVMNTKKVRDVFKIYRHPCGMRMVKNDHGQWDLEGTPTFAHLTESYLRKRFAIMRPDRFAKNYCLEILSASDVTFRREDFNVIPRWESWMANNYGYILTDVATSDEKEGCQSVIAMVSLDSRDHAYLHDLDVGHWPQPSTFLDKFFRMYEEWSARMVMKGATFERNALTNIYRRAVEQGIRERNIRDLFVIPITRPPKASKNDRISSLQPRFAGNRFHVIDEDMPKMVTDVGQNLTVWDSEGYLDEDGRAWPDGELVKQFIFSPRYGKKDIADALADMDQCDAQGRRYCVPPPFSKSLPTVGYTLPEGLVVPATMNVNGFIRVVDIAKGGNGGGDWFARKLAEMKGSAFPRKSLGLPGRRR